MRRAARRIHPADATSHPARPPAPEHPNSSPMVNTTRFLDGNRAEASRQSDWRLRERGTTSQQSLSLYVAPCLFCGGEKGSWKIIAHYLIFFQSASPLRSHEGGRLIPAPVVLFVCKETEIANRVLLWERRRDGIKFAYLEQ